MIPVLGIMALVAKPSPRNLAEEVLEAMFAANRSFEYLEQIWHSRSYKANLLLRLIAW